MNISRSLLPALLLVASALVKMSTAATKTDCDVVQNGFCYQYCLTQGCTMQCLDSENYHSCIQICKGGNCIMTCDATSYCVFSCTAGNCQTEVCKADTCRQNCYHGECGMKCQGNSCEQSCDWGNCLLQCPSDASKCQQYCSMNSDKCIIRVE